MVVKSQLSGHVVATAISSGGKKPGAVAADFDADKVAGFVEGHFFDDNTFQKNLGTRYYKVMLQTDSAWHCLMPDLFLTQL